MTLFKNETDAHGRITAADILLDGSVTHLNGNRYFVSFVIPRKENESQQNRWDNGVNSVVFANGNASSAIYVTGISVERRGLFFDFTDARDTDYFIGGAVAERGGTKWLASNAADNAADVTISKLPLYAGDRLQFRLSFEGANKNGSIGVSVMPLGFNGLEGSFNETRSYSHSSGFMDFSLTVTGKGEFLGQRWEDGLSFAVSLCGLQNIGAVTKIYITNVRITRAATGRTPLIESGIYALPDSAIYAGDKRIEIGAYHAPTIFASQADMDDIAAAGISLIITERDMGDFNRYVSDTRYPQTPQERIAILDRAHNAGIKMIMQDGALQGNLETANNSWDTKNVQYYKNHPALYGVDIRDEPAFSEFSTLAALKTNFYNAFPSDKLFFVNLFPSFVSPALTGGSAGEWYSESSQRSRWRGYVDSHMSVVQPPLLAYDHYALMAGPAGNSIRSAFFHDLEYVRRKASAAGIPAMTAIQSAGENLGAISNYKWVTTEDLRWQMACAMAYGYEMITHYSYALRGADVQSAIDHDTGEKLDLYYYMQTANLEIRKWDGIYMNYGWRGTAALGGDNTRLFNPTANLGLSPTVVTGNPFNNIASGGNAAISGFGALTAATLPNNNQAALIGHFEDDAGNKGYMLTNATRPNADTPVSVTCTFASAYGAVLIYTKGIPTIVPLNGSNQIILTLEPGEGRFVVPLKLI